MLWKSIILIVTLAAQLAKGWLYLTGRIGSRCGVRDISRQFSCITAPHRELVRHRSLKARLPQPPRGSILLARAMSKTAAASLKRPYELYPPEYLSHQLTKISRSWMKRPLL